MGLVGREDDEGRGWRPTSNSPLVKEAEEGRLPWGECDTVGNSWVT